MEQCMVSIKRVCLFSQLEKCILHCSKRDPCGLEASKDQPQGEVDVAVEGTVVVLTHAAAPTPVHRPVGETPCYPEKRTQFRA